MDGRISALRRCQVQDVTRTSFRVGVKRASKNGSPLFHQGLPVYKDVTGAMFTVSS